MATPGGVHSACDFNGLHHQSGITARIGAKGLFRELSNCQSPQFSPARILPVGNPDLRNTATIRSQGNVS